MSASKHRLVDTYRDVLRRSGEMLELANAGQWEQLLEMQIQTGFMINPSLLEHVRKHHALDPSEVPEANKLFGEIIELWKVIQGKMIARRDELAHLIESAERQEANGGLGKIVRTNTYSRADLFRNTAK